MKITIHLNGYQYNCKVTDEKTKQEAADAFYAQLEDFSKLQVELEDGHILLLGKQAIQSASFIISD